MEVAVGAVLVKAMTEDAAVLAHVDAVAAEDLGSVWSNVDCSAHLRLHASLLQNGDLPALSAKGASREQTRNTSPDNDNLEWVWRGSCSWGSGWDDGQLEPVLVALAKHQEVLAAMRLLVAIERVVLQVSSSTHCELT
jgi:hypothetical protein